MTGALMTALLGPPVLAGGAPAGAATPGANPNGVLRYGIDLNDTFSNTFDPGQSTNDCGYAIYSNIYDSALAPSNTQVLPSLIQSWQVTPTSVTLHIRPGVVFSNGDPVDANAVAQSIMHIRMSPFRSSLTAIESMQVANPDTLVLNLNRPTPGDLLWALTYIDGMVMDPASIANAATSPVGAGPFTLQNYQQGSSIQLKANPRYWNKSQYHLGGVNFIQVSPGPQSVGALESGAVDMIALEPENYPQVKGDSNIGIAVTQSYDYMVIQMRENAAPFNDPKIRAALEYAVNRAAINQAVYDGLGQPAYQPWPNFSPAFNKSVGDRYTYQPQKARALLAKAGHPRGVHFTLVVPAGDATFARSALIMQSELAQAGFFMTIKQVTPSDLLTEVYLHGVGDALLSSQLTNGPDLANNFESEYEGLGFQAQHLGTENPTLTPLIQQASESINANVQGPLMQKAGAIAMSTGTEIPIVFQPSIIAYNKTVVGGKVVAPIGQCRSNLSGIYIKK